MATLTRKQRELFSHLELSATLIHQAQDALQAAQQCAQGQTEGELTALSVTLRSVGTGLARLEQNVMLEHLISNIRVH